MSMSEADMSVAGYEKVYDYSQYAHVNNVNVIPEKDFKRLVEDTFKTIADILRPSYGPYGSVMMISEQNETTTTKDGYNIFCATGFSHAYKRMVYLAIKKIIERVNRNVGDGTTSCILLAEKMFKSIENCIRTPDDKRNVLKILNAIEHDLQNPEELKNDDDIIVPLNMKALSGLLNIAGNYDDELSDILMKAFDPEIDEESDNDLIHSIRNVVVESRVDPDGDSTVSYEVNYLPGDYRVRVNMGMEQALLFDKKRKIRVALYDHAFGSSDWNFFMHNFDKETETLIMARSFNRSFMDNEYVRYYKDRQLTKQPIKIILCEVKGNYFKHEIADLAAILNTTPIGMESKAVVHEELPIAEIEIFKENCMCFYTDNIPTEYIKSLTYEMDSDVSDSMIKRADYINRINALHHKNKDTMVIVKAGTSLELKMITDKIDDCVCAVKSALTYGIVPNMLVYGNYRIEYMDFNSDLDGDLAADVTYAISQSIKGLFRDIWISKYGEDLGDIYDTFEDKLYHITPTPCSFDIISNSWVGTEDLPSSAQYDLEVIVAAISIVKYLLTSRALIFDAHLMQQVTDVGHYEQL